MIIAYKEETLQDYVDCHAKAILIQVLTKGKTCITIMIILVIYKERDETLN